jgi:hypothetical protein
MTSAVMSYDAKAVLEEKNHLRVPVIRRQRPAMAEHDGLTFAPVLVKDLDAVFGRNRTHGYLLRGKSALDADIHRRIDEKLAPFCVMSGYRQMPLYLNGYHQRHHRCHSVDC